MAPGDAGAAGDFVDMQGVCPRHILCSYVPGHIKPVRGGTYATTCLPSHMYLPTTALTADLNSLAPKGHWQTGMMCLNRLFLDLLVAHFCACCVQLQRRLPKQPARHNETTQPVEGPGAGTPASKLHIQ